MNKNLIKKEYVIQANNQKGKDDWYDYIRSDKKSSALKTLEKLNTSDPDGKYRLIVYKAFGKQYNVFGKQVDIKKETAHETPKTITLGKWEYPLEWTVIDKDEDRILLLCNTCVAKKSFDKSLNIYSLSEIRSWLNNHDATYNKSDKDYTKIGFLNAFTDEEINRLEHFDGAPWNDDYVGLLSVDEYEKYKERIPKINRTWWLRSPGSGTHYAAIVNYHGIVDYDVGYVDDGYFDVRPALWLKK